VFCPALTDGSFGDMLWAHSYKTDVPLVIDIVGDIRRLNDLSMRAKKAGMVILGGGVCKHQIANSMLFVSRSLSCVGVCVCVCFLNMRIIYTEERCRLLSLHQHGTRVRRVRQRRKTRRGRQLGQNPRRRRVRKSLCRRHTRLPSPCSSNLGQGPPQQSIQHDQDDDDPERERDIFVFVKNLCLVLFLLFFLLLF
jgi:hypothetical protein